MKGVNVRKIAALAAGTALLGAAVGIADVVYGNTQLVDQNGQPTVKVVVGSTAAASDGVVAANIAAKIANLAYKSSTLTAEVKGDATCSVGGGEGGEETGAGSCAVTNKKANLEVTLPGVTAGAYQFTTLISDFIDRMPGNRNKETSDDRYTGTVDTSSTTSGLYGDNVDANVIRATQDLYKISGDQFSPFASSTVNDASGAKTYSETQALWVHGETKFDASLDQVVGAFKGMGYTAKFDSGSDGFGVLICTGTNGTSSSAANYNECSNTDAEHINTHKTEVQFLGQTWILSELSPPSATAASTANGLASATATLFGGSVKLAKASQAGIVSVGEELDAGSVKIRLSDISVATGASNAHPAIVDILDANGALLQQTTISEGTTYSYTAPDGVVIKIRVYKTAPGITLNAKWADMAVLTDELTLKNAEMLSTDSTNPNYQWYSYLRWKNKGWTSGLDDTYVGANQTDNLREIILYYGEPKTGLTAGSGVNIIGNPAVYTLSYDGLSTSGSDVDRLRFSIVDSSEMGSAAGEFPGSGSVAGGMTSNTTCSSTGTISNEKFLKVESGTANAFKIPGSGGEYVTKFYYRYNPGQYNVAIDVINTSLAHRMWLYYKPTNANCWYWVGANFTQDLQATVRNTTYSNAVEYDNGGTGTAQGYISIIKVANKTGLQVYVQEDGGKLGTTTQNHDSFLFNITGASNQTNLAFTAPDNDNTDRMYYNAVNTTTGALDAASNYYDAPLISQRGSKFVSMTSDTVIFDMSKKLAEAKYVLKSAGTGSVTNTLKRSLGEGESMDVTGGIKIKVASITETVGSCVAGAVAGAAPACQVDSSGQSAVIMPNNAASVEVSEPYMLSSDMVVLDSAAAGVGKKISVGGPLVNTVTRDALGNTVDFSTTTVVVKEVGDTVVVAGTTAADTMTAGSQFVAGIRRQ